MCRSPDRQIDRISADHPIPDQQLARSFCEFLGWQRDRADDAPRVCANANVRRPSVRSQSALARGRPAKLRLKPSRTTKLASASLGQHRLAALRGADIFYSPPKTCFIRHGSGDRRCLPSSSEHEPGNREEREADHVSGHELSAQIPDCSQTGGGACQGVRGFLVRGFED
jgi:hypothetical protein